MKKFLKIAAVSMLFAFAASNAQAQEIKPYVGIGLGGFTTDFGSGFKTDASFGGFIKGGVDFNSYIGAELRIGSVSSSNVKLSGTSTISDSKIDYFLSYLAKPQFPITEQATIYGLIGASTLKTTVTTGFSSISSTNTQVSFGGGFEYTFQDVASVGAEYVQYSNNANDANKEVKLTGISATASYHF